MKGGLVVHTIQATLPESKTEATLHHHGLQRYRLGLYGRLEPGWAGLLSNALALRQVSITRVEAVRATGWNWQSVIDLDFSSATVVPDKIDFIALSSRALPGPFPVPAGIMLDDYQLERATRCGGSRYLEACGPDRIGLLSSLLNTFNLFSLFPAEMLVETQKKRVFDRFWLKGLGGAAPSEEAVSALRERMRGFCTAK